MLKYREAIEVLPDSHVEVSHIRSNMASCYMHSEPGECYEALNKLDSALRDVCLVSELDPNNPMASEIAVKLKRTLEGKGLMVKDSAIELPADYVEPVAAHLALWAKKEECVKFVYSDDVRLAELPLNCTLFHLREVVHERFPSLRAVHIKYKDQEGDLVTITTDEELRMSEEVSSSLEKMRFYVVEVSPEQDPFFGRLVEMKKLRITADSFKAKANGKGRCKIEDWMVEFARLFKIQANIADSDDTTCLNLQELGMKLNSEAMEEVVTSEEAQLPFEKAAKQFQELVARARESEGEVRRGHESKPDLLEVFLALALQHFEEARLSWYYAC
ncbi:Octicosapeptide/Phox/Bem1p (PB1) domain-containing protein / TPR-containing protein [Raphanus sativus]|nr:Octicosapeptide/Phox/Bem1p (PB1) domain-containing protein / TPR-containing protein [Raphanus sativus]